MRTTFLREVLLNEKVIGQFVGDLGEPLKYQSLRGCWISEEGLHWEKVGPYSQEQEIWPQANHIFKSHGLYFVVPSL